FLNGASSSGKTSLTRTLQALWPRALAVVGIDMLITMLPPAYTGFGEHAAQGYPFTVETDDEGRSVTRASTGPLGRILERRLGEFVAGLAADGLDVVVDHVVTDETAFFDAVGTLDPSTAYLIGLRCDLPTLALREKARGDRALNLALDQHQRVHAGPWRYDLELDSTSSSSADLAKAVIAFVAAKPPRALGELLAR
ncbi:MAG TPA: hypothetical protein VIO94_15560, partial [Phenylobacterium sp.]